MEQMAPVTHILPVTTITRTRLLPVAGEVVVRKGQKVNPSDVVAEAGLHPEHILLDVARGLGLPAEKADERIQRHAGEEVAAGDVIAGPVGLGRRVVRTPQAGKVVVAGSGQVLIEVSSKPFELQAGFAGTVIDLIPDHGVVLSTVGALIQCAWGNGRIDFGLINLEMHSPEDELAANRLDVSVRGSVVLASYCADPNVLTTAGDLPVRGLILASMEASLVPLALKMRYPIVVIEGFGRIPMNSAAFKLLTTSARREASLNAEAWDCYAGTRPEIIISLPASESRPAPETEIFKEGQQVRAWRAPYQGKTGSLHSLLPGLTLLPNGIRTRAAEVRLETGESVTIPLANLEVLE